MATKSKTDNVPVQESEAPKTEVQEGRPATLEECNSKLMDEYKARHQPTGA